MKKVGHLYKDSSTIHLTNRNILSSITFDLTYGESHFLNQSPYLQSFAYTDHITSKVLPVDSEATPKKHESPNKTYDYTNCFGLMKSTRQFHMSTLKEKNYKQINQTSSTLNVRENVDEHKQRTKRYIIRRQKQRQNYIKQKLHLSKLLDNDRRYLYASADVSLNLTPRKNIQIQKQQMHNVRAQSSSYQTHNNSQLSDTDVFKNIQQKKSINNQVTKNAAESNVANQTLAIFQQYDQFQKKQKIKKIGRGQKQKKTQQFLNMDQLSSQVKKYVQKLDRQLRHQITKDAQYLVEPNAFNLADKIRRAKRKKPTIKNQKPVTIKQPSSKFLRRARILNLIQANSEQPNPDTIQADKQNKVQRDFSTELKDYSFRNRQQYQIGNKAFVPTQKYGKDPHNSLMYEQKNLIRSIMQGNYFKVQIQLSLNNNLIHTKQARSNNNLLHLCIINNQKQIYDMIVAKCKQFSVDLFNQPNKYNKTPLQLAKVYRFIEIGTKHTRHTVGIK